MPLQRVFRYWGFREVSKFHSTVFSQPRTYFSQAESKVTYMRHQWTRAALDLELSSETVAVLCVLYERERGSGAELVTRISEQSRSFFRDGY